MRPLGALGFKVWQNERENILNKKLVINKVIINRV